LEALEGSVCWPNPPVPLESQPMASPELPESSSAMRASYTKVLVVWALTLAALYAFQQYFS